MIDFLHTIFGPYGLVGLAAFWALKLGLTYLALRLWRARRARVRARGVR